MTLLTDLENATEGSREWSSISTVPRDQRVEILGLDGCIWRARFQLEYDHNPYPEGSSDWFVGCIASFRFHDGELASRRSGDEPQCAYNITATHWRAIEAEKERVA